LRNKGFKKIGPACSVSDLHLPFSHHAAYSISVQIGKQSCTHIFPQIQLPVPHLPTQILQPQLDIIAHPVLFQRFGVIYQRKGLCRSAGGFGAADGRCRCKGETLAIGDKL
jgi:hypothetical protein